MSDRNYSKESAWERKAYQIFSFKARRDNGENERLKNVMGDRSFGEWVRDMIKICEEQASK